MFGVVAAAIVVVLAVGGVVASRIGDARGESISSRRRPLGVEWSALASPPGANAITSVVGHGPTLVATGNTIPSNGGELWATIWFSSDAGASWTRVFDEPSVRNPNVPPGSGPVWLEREMAEAFAIDGMFVVRGSMRLPDGSVRAALWTSHNGVDWSRVDDSLFEPTVSSESDQASVLRSTVYDITGWQRGLLAVGEVFTNSSAPAGVTPATWTSADGVVWKRELVDLGDGYDPYFDSVATTQDRAVATGRMGRWPIVQWTSRDLRTWNSSLVDANTNGSARVNVVAGGFIASGVQTAGPLGRDHDPSKVINTPSIWWSPDARRWQPAFKLPARRNGDGNWFFGPAQSTGRVAVVTGPMKNLTGPNAANRLYGSTDGRKWSSLPAPDATARSFVVAGANDDLIYIRGAGTLDPKTQRAPLLLWSVALHQ
jgi:hypothetical protein